LNILDTYAKTIQISNFMKICSLGADLLHADRWKDRWTDMTHLIVAFRNFAKVLNL